MIQKSGTHSILFARFCLQLSGWHNQFIVKESTADTSLVGKMSCPYVSPQFIDFVFDVREETFCTPGFKQRDDFGWNITAWRMCDYVDRYIQVSEMVLLRWNVLAHESLAANGADNKPLFQQGCEA